MRRIFWVALGATAGVLVVRKLTRAAHRVTPAGMAEGISDVGDRARSGFSEFFDTVSEYAAEREDELRAALGLDDAEPGESEDRR